MNKEQFKKSILDLLNYYIGQMVQFNLSAKDAQDAENEAVFKMIDAQAQAVSVTFEQNMDELLDKFCGEEKEVIHTVDESQGIPIEIIHETSEKVEE